MSVCTGTAGVSMVPSSFSLVRVREHDPEVDVNRCHEDNFEFNFKKNKQRLKAKDEHHHNLRTKSLLSTSTPRHFIPAATLK